MAVSARIKFTQGITTAPAGEALIGALTTPVVVSNGDDTGASYWAWEVVSSPPGSAVTAGVKSQGSVAAFTFAPDVRGGYLLHLTTRDALGNQAEDYRTFQVPETTGRIIPPFGADSNALNFGGQERGWDPYLRAYLEQIDIGGFSGLTVQDAGVTVGDRPTLNFVGAQTIVDNPGASRIDVTLASTLEVDSGGVAVGARPKLNFIGAKSVADNPGQDRVDVDVTPRVSVKADGALVGTRAALNFTGSTVTDNPGQDRVDVTAVTSLEVDADGFSVATRAKLNFVGAQSVTDNPGASRVDVDVTPKLIVDAGGVLVATRPAINLVGAQSVTDNPGGNRVDIDVTPKLIVDAAGVLVGTRPALNFIGAASVVDNVGSNRVDVDVSTALAVQSAGAAVATRSILNFVSGATVVDNPGSSRVDVTVSASASMAWTQEYLVNYTAQTPQNFSSDTSFTVDGKTLYSFNVANTNTATAVGANGLVFTPKQATDISAATSTAPFVLYLLPQFITARKLNWARGFRFWFRISNVSEVGNYDALIFGIKHFNDNTFVRSVKRGFVLGGQGCETWWIESSTNLAHSYTAFTLATYDVFVVEIAPLGQGGGIQPFVGSFTGGAFPADTTLTPCEGSMMMGGTAGLQPWTPSAMALMIGAQRSGSGTTYAPRISHMRVDSW